MIAKRTNDATSSSAASIASSSSVASPRVTRKPPELSSPCYALQPQGFGLKLSTRPSQHHEKALSGRPSVLLDRILAMPAALVTGFSFAVVKAKQDATDMADKTHTILIAGGS